MYYPKLIKMIEIAGFIVTSKIAAREIEYDNALHKVYNASVERGWLHGCHNYYNSYGRGA